MVMGLPHSSSGPGPVTPGAIDTVVIGSRWSGILNAWRSHGMWLACRIGKGWNAQCVIYNPSGSRYSVNAGILEVR
jgi:hypothetical protein